MLIGNGWISGFLDFLHFNQDLLFYYFHNMDPVSELRQRRKEEDEGTTVPNRSITKRLEKFDIYPKIGDDYVVVASDMDVFKGMLKLNESGALIFKKMQENVSVDDIVDLILSEYEIERDIAKRDVTAFINTFKEVGLIEE